MTISGAMGKNGRNGAKTKSVGVHIGINLIKLRNKSMKNIKDMNDLELLEMEGDDERMTEVEEFYRSKYAIGIDNCGGNGLSYRAALREISKEM